MRQAIYQALKLHNRHRQFSSKESGVSMLRIETEVDGARTILRLIGRVRFDCIEELRQSISGDAALVPTVNLLEEGVQRMDRISERLLGLARNHDGQKQLQKPGHPGDQYLKRRNAHIFGGLGGGQ